MNKNIDYEQLENISSSLLKGFISWIEINDSQERAMILDSAYQFKFSILEQDKSTVQKKYFISPKDLSKDEALLLLNQWKDTFSQIINSDLDRISKDSFKLWFLSLASFLMPILENETKVLWDKLLDGIEYCQNFSIKDVPYPLNKITKN